MWYCPSTFPVVIQTMDLVCIAVAAIMKTRGDKPAPKMVMRKKPKSLITSQTCLTCPGRITSDFLLSEENKPTLKTSKVELPFTYS